MMCPFVLDLYGVGMSVFFLVFLLFSFTFQFALDISLDL